MSIVFFLSIFLALVMSAFSYFVFNDWQLFSVNIAVTIVFILYLNIRFTVFYKANERRQLMYNFIELFILNYDIQKSVDGTLSGIYPLLPPKALRRMSKGKKEEGMMFLESLRAYFGHNYYESFIDAVTLINERGGEIMKITEVLLFSISNSEAQSVKLTRIDNSYLIKFVFNWLFTMLVAIIFRFSLTGTLNFDVLPPVYIMGMELFLAIFLVSLALVVENRIRRATSVG